MNSENLIEREINDTHRLSRYLNIINVTKDSFTLRIFHKIPKSIIVNVTKVSEFKVNIVCVHPDDIISMKESVNCELAEIVSVISTLCGINSSFTLRLAVEKCLEVFERKNYNITLIDKNHIRCFITPITEMEFECRKTSLGVFYMPYDKRRDRYKSNEITLDQLYDTASKSMFTIGYMLEDVENFVNHVKPSVEMLDRVMKRMNE